MKFTTPCTTPGLCPQPPFSKWDKGVSLNSPGWQWIYDPPASPTLWVGNRGPRGLAYCCTFFHFPDFHLSANARTKILKISFFLLHVPFFFSQNDLTYHCDCVHDVCVVGRVGVGRADSPIESVLIFYHYLASRDLTQLVRLTQGVQELLSHLLDPTVRCFYV